MTKPAILITVLLDDKRNPTKNDKDMSKVIANPQLSFGEALREAKNKWIDWKGRSRRSEYWWCALCAFVVTYLLALIPTIGGVISFVISLLMIPLTIRRVHDTGRSGWWVIASMAFGLILSAYYLYKLGAAYSAESISLSELVKIITDPLLIIFYLVTLVVGIILLVFLCQDSKVEPNKWGMSPKYKVVEDHEAGKAYQQSDLDKTINNVGDKIDEMVDKAQDGADDAFDKAKDFADDAVDKIKDVADDAVDKVKDVAGDAFDKAKDFADDAVDKMKDVADDMKEAAEDAVGKAKDAMKKD